MSPGCHHGTACERVHKVGGRGLDAHHTVVRDMRPGPPTPCPLVTGPHAHARGGPRAHPARQRRVSTTGASRRRGRHHRADGHAAGGVMTVSITNTVALAVGMLPQSTLAPLTV